MACMRCEISTFIKDNGVDLFFVTETWLSAQGDEAKTVELAPNGFDVKSFPLQSRSRGGGIEYMETARLLWLSKSTMYNLNRCQRCAIMAIIGLPLTTLTGGIPKETYFFKRCTLTTQLSTNTIDELLIEAEML